MTVEKKEKEKIEEIENYLKGYAFGAKLLRLEKYEKNYFGRRGTQEEESFGEAPLARARMFEIRHFIMDMKSSDEKLLLYFHYIKCEPVEKCAELLGISRSSAFRMKRRALALAADMAIKKGVALKGSDT